jgi:hypothetical protein
LLGTAVCDELYILLVELPLLELHARPIDFVVIDVLLEVIVILHSLVVVEVKRALQIFILLGRALTSILPGISLLVLLKHVIQLGGVLAVAYTLLLRLLDVLFAIHNILEEVH